MSKRKRTRKRNRQTPQRRRWFVPSLVIVIVLVGATAAAAWRWQHLRRVTIDPPTIDADGVDFAVVNVIQDRRDAVLTARQEVRAWGNLGMTLLAHAFNNQAAICFEQAEQLDSNDVRWPYYWADCVALTNRRDAVSHLERAVAVCGNSPETPRLKLVELLLELHEFDRAEEHLSAFLSESGDHPRARLAKGRLLFMRGDYEASLSQLQQLDQDTPAAEGRKKTLKLLMAESLRRTGRDEEAEAMRDAANRETVQNWPDPLMNKVKAMRTGLKSYLVRADLMFGRREYEDVIKLLTQTVESYPESTWAKIHLGRALIRTGAPDSRLPDTEKVQRLAAAEAIILEALKLDKNSVEALYRLGVVFAYQGRDRESIECYEKAIRMKPDFTMAYYNLAGMRNRINDSEGAIEALRAAISTEPEFANAHFLLGWCLMNENRYAEATRHLEVASRLIPNRKRVADLYNKAKRMALITED